MRIALIVPGGVDRSGEYRVVPALLALIERLARQHEVHVFALRQEAEPGQWQLLGAQVHNIGTRRTYLRGLRRLRAVHRRAPFDIVHAIWSGAGGALAVAAGRLLGIPSLVHVAGGELAALPDIGYGDGLRWRGRLRERLVLRSASAVSAASAPVIAALLRLGVIAHRVPLGVDLAAWPARTPVRRLAGAAARLIHVASLNQVKDQVSLLHALAALANSGLNFTVDIVGEDILQGAMQALATQLGLSTRTTFHGFLPQPRVHALVQAADLLVISSRHETGPLVLLEAAAVGVPAVGTAVGHVAEWSPQAALAVPVGDPSALAQAIAAVLADEELRLRLATGAQRRATLEDADHTARSFLALYRQLSGGASP